MRAPSSEYLRERHLANICIERAPSSEYFFEEAPSSEYLRERHLANTYFPRTPSSEYVRHCGLVVSAPDWDGTGCEFDSLAVSDINYIPCSWSLRLLGSWEIIGRLLGRGDGLEVEPISRNPEGRGSIPRLGSRKVVAHQH